MQMLERLEDSFTRLSQFSADLAHELRTPIANLRGESEVALTRPRTPEEYREVVESSVAECERLSGIIDNLLFLARAEAAKGTSSAALSMAVRRSKRSPPISARSRKSVRSRSSAAAKARSMRIRCYSAGP